MTAELHQIVKAGAEPLTLVGILPGSPVPLVDAAGAEIPLPW